MVYATSAQKAMIHALKSKLSLPDEHYRDMLSAYNVGSSKDLTFTQAKEFIIQILTGKCRNSGIPTKSPQARDMISSSQIAMIRGMWSQVSRQTTDSARRNALDELIRRKYGISRLEWVPFETVHRLVKTLTSMGAHYVK